MGPGTRTAWIAALVATGVAVGALLISPVGADSGTPDHEWTEHYLPKLKRVSGIYAISKNGPADVPGGEPIINGNIIASRSLPPGKFAITATVLFSSEQSSNDAVTCLLEFPGDAVFGIVTLRPGAAESLTIGAVGSVGPAGGTLRLRCSDFDGGATNTEYSDLRVNAIEAPKLAEKTP
jgi:hypothetical protein